MGIIAEEYDAAQDLLRIAAIFIHKKCKEAIRFMLSEPHLKRSPP